ncbi:MAG: hypothetical protein U5K30_16085 [Acidimicrobiales bacterium]|nr:hypothetical protein [Acidimicrobiales bacterium]
MTATATADVFARALDDEQFARTLVEDPDKALASYDVSDEERHLLLEDAEDLHEEVSGFTVQQFVTIGYLQPRTAEIDPRIGAALGGAIDRMRAACGDNGCCSWESKLC